MKKLSFKKWLLVFVGLLVLFSAGYYFVRKTVLNSAYDSLRPTTLALQDQLNNGTSPNGALAKTFYGDYSYSLSRDLSSELKDKSGKASFGIVVEQTKSYITSSGKLNGLVPVPPVGFLDATKANGSGSMVWQPAKDTRVVVQALMYHYGDITGYVITGQSAKPYEQKLLIYKLVALVVLVGVAVWTYRAFVRTPKK